MRERGVNVDHSTIHRWVIHYAPLLENEFRKKQKRITEPMMGFKAFHSAQATLAGIELHHMLRKGQHVHSDSQTIFEQFYALAA